MKLLRSFLAAVVPLLMGLETVVARDPVAPKPKEPEAVSYYRDVRRIFEQNCQGCHQPAKASGSFVINSYSALLQKGESGDPPIVAGKPDASKIIMEISPHAGKPPAMPKGKEPLLDQEVQVIKK